MLVKWGCALGFSFLLSLHSLPLAEAAKPQSRAPLGGQTVSLTEAQELVLMALALPKENRLQALKIQASQPALGASAFRALEQLAFDRSQGLQVRWRAITSLAQVYPDRAQPILNQAARSREWFMRNAALVAMSSMPRDYALGWARRLSQDSALVVRTAAVQLLAEIGDSGTEGLLWKQLYAAENFHQGQSLFVRRHIVKALSNTARPGQESRFIRILQESDARLHPFAIQAMEKISGRSLTQEGATVSQVKAQWLEWWDQSQDAAQGLSL